MRATSAACGCLVFLALLAPAGAQTAPATNASEVSLFDFEQDTKDWAPASVPDVKDVEPAVKIETTADGATSGQQALKLTFDGGHWPCVATTVIPVEGNWKPYQTLRADLSVDRPTIAWFRVEQDKKDDKRNAPHWDRTLILQPGRTAAVLTIRLGPGGAVIDPARGNIARFIIGAYRPAKGQTLLIDNVRLSKSGPNSKLITNTSPYSQDGYSSAAAAEFARTMKLSTFKVIGTDMEVASVGELGAKLAKEWKQPEPNTLDGVEADFKARFDELKKTHPNVRMAILRDGEKGFDPSDPEKFYAGWKDVHISSHGPDGPNDGRETNSGRSQSTEIFMRHRSALMRVDLSSIPRDANVLVAQLVIPRHLASDLKAPAKPNMWVVEPCARDWNEYEVTGYWAAKDTPWKAVNGIYYGENPDFHPLFLAYGPGNVVNVWDFVQAVKFWQTHDNHGFMLHGDSTDYMVVSTHEDKNIKSRPAVLIAWEPKP